MAGQLDIICFDKTGTLTEEGVDVMGVISVTEGTNPKGHSTLSSMQSVQVCVYAPLYIRMYLILKGHSTLPSMQSVQVCVYAPLYIRMYLVPKGHWTLSSMQSVQVCVYAPLYIRMYVMAKVLSS